MTENIIVRTMKSEERQEVRKISRAAFQWLEGIFITSPKEALVFDLNGRIIAGVGYKISKTGQQKVGHIDQVFVDPAYHGRGYGKQLLEEAFQFLWEQGCTGLTCLVKGDNVGSWKLFENAGFKRVSMKELTRQLGWSGMIGQLISTPFLWAPSMDIYLKMKEEKVEEKENSLGQFLTFLLVNLAVFALGRVIWGQEDLVSHLVSYSLVLLLFALPSFLTQLLSQQPSVFRFNNAGFAFSLVFALLGIPFPMNATCYPKVYERGQDFKRRLAFSSVLRWSIFLLLGLTGLASQAPFYHYLFSYLILMSFPIYPLQEFGGGRVYQYHKPLYYLLLILSLTAFTLFTLVF